MIIYWIVFFWAIIQFILLIGKLLGIIKWDWWTVYAPLLVALLLLGLLTMFFLITIIVGQVLIWFLILII